MWEEWRRWTGRTCGDSKRSYAALAWIITTDVHVAVTRACSYRSRSYGLGKPCSSRLSTLLMAATVGWDSVVSLRVSSSRGMSWNSLRSLAFLAASLLDTAKHTVRRFHIKMKIIVPISNYKKIKVMLFFMWSVSCSGKLPSDTCLDSVSSSMKCSNRDRWSS